MLHSNELSYADLEIHARVYPQILSFSTDFDRKYGEAVVIAVVYSDNYESEAEYFKASVGSYYGGLIRNKKLEVRLFNEMSFQKSKLTPSAVYVLSDTRYSVELLSELGRRSVITFAGSKSSLENGALFGLSVTDKIMIFLNKSTFKLGNYNFDISLMRKVGIYENK